MTTSAPVPAKRGPGRPRKNPLPPAPTPTPESESKTFIDEVVAANATDALLAAGNPQTASEVAALIDVPVAVVTTILDNLVSSGELVLDDDDRYWFEGRVLPVPVSVPNPSAEQITAAPEDVAVSSDTDESATKPEVRTVNLPTSDLVNLLSNINLPPQMISGLGALSRLSGVLTFEVLEPSDEDPRPTGRLSVAIEGTHARSAPALNPNQPGYVNPSSSPMILPSES